MISAVSSTKSDLFDSSIMSLHQDVRVCRRRAAQQQRGPTPSAELLGRTLPLLPVYNGSSNKVQHHWLPIQEKSLPGYVFEPDYSPSSRAGQLFSQGCFASNIVLHLPAVTRLALAAFAWAICVTRRLEADRPSKRGIDPVIMEPRVQPTTRGPN